MANSQAKAEKWIELLLNQKLPNKSLVKEHFAAACVCNLCECGCNSFSLAIPAHIALPPLQNRDGLFCEIAFKTNLEDELDMLLFTDERGYISGVDVTYGAANHARVPEDLEIGMVIGVWPSSSRTKNQ